MIGLEEPLLEDAQQVAEQHQVGQAARVGSLELVLAERSCVGREELERLERDGFAYESEGALIMDVANADDRKVAPPLILK